MKRENSIRTAMAHSAVALMMLAGLLAACGSSSSSDSGGGSPPPAPQITLVLTDSGGNMTPGTRVGVWTGFVTNGTCLTGTTWVAYVSYFPTSSGTATVTVAGTPGYEANAVMFSIWIDEDANNHLSNGDKVWGTNGPVGQIGKVCDSNFANLASHFPPNASMDWSASGIPGISGTSTWGGGTMPQ